MHEQPKAVVRPTPVLLCQPGSGLFGFPYARGYTPNPLLQMCSDTAGERGRRMEGRRRPGGLSFWPPPTCSCCSEFLLSHPVAAAPTPGRLRAHVLACCPCSRLLCSLLLLSAGACGEHELVQEGFRLCVSSDPRQLLADSYGARGHICWPVGIQGHAQAPALQSQPPCWPALGE